MKRILIVTSVILAGICLFFALSGSGPGAAPRTIVKSSDSLFEAAVEIIKKYETMHQPRHWPLVGYGHKVLPGERFSRSRAMNETDAEILLRKDLLKNCAVFRDWGRDSLLLGVLAYNIGSGATKNSSVARKLKNGDRDIYDNYVAHSRYRGKSHAQIRRRRIEEFNTLFRTDTVLLENVVPAPEVTLPAAPAGRMPSVTPPDNNIK